MPNPSGSLIISRKKGLCWLLDGGEDRSSGRAEQARTNWRAEARVMVGTDHRAREALDSIGRAHTINGRVERSAGCEHALAGKRRRAMSTFVLVDVSSDVWVECSTVDAPALGLAEEHSWSVKKQRLRGGRRDGVDLIVVDNGALRFLVLPTRGMGLWKGWYDGNRLGWDSPITDGPVHPALVNLGAPAASGWLDGFDELLARCGLENNGAPFEIKTRKADGSTSRTTFGLHGKIANIPASYVAVHVGAEPPHEIVVEGHVEESRMFGPQIRMETRITTVPGSNYLVVRDEFVNLKEQPVEMQILYHWNFGPPFLDAGAVRRADQIGDAARSASARSPCRPQCLRRTPTRLFRASLLLRATCSGG